MTAYKRLQYHHHHRNPSILLDNSVSSSSLTSAQRDPHAPVSGIAWGICTGRIHFPGTDYSILDLSDLIEG